MVEWLCECDRVIAPETFYLDDRIMEAGVGTRLQLLVNPELFVPSYAGLARRGIIEVYAPTEWEVERLGAHTLLPQPVARDVIPYRTRLGVARTFLHISSPAMLDRNGTQLVRAACERYDGLPIDLMVAGPAKPAEVTTVGEVTIYPVPDVESYWERWQADIDVLLQPRRYGGLSMVQLEAAAAGCPTICLERDPERTWGGALTVPVTGSSMARMKGGDFSVYEAEPGDVADAMAWCSTLIDITEASDAASAWAERNSWTRLLDRWERTLA